MERPEIRASPEVGAFQIGRAKGRPGTGPEDFFQAYVVHVDWNAQHGGQCD